MCWAYGWAGPVAWPGSIPQTLYFPQSEKVTEGTMFRCLADVGRAGVWAVATRLGGVSVGGRAPETKVTVQRGTRAVQWAGPGLRAVGRAGWVGCAPGFVQSLSMKKPQI
ncbi:uncharacterized protein MONOS_17623 [Monocercomonoides exilis]|uniref:uncharacterized protein n=1 Tax=Monocercomonoides exilis TaxID=2049356 RepID=UPI003559D9D6|nr:hypothetical protein MONOS_17623 [Monocercomonoides exilis]